MEFDCYCHFEKEEREREKRDRENFTLPNYSSNWREQIPSVTFSLHFLLFFLSFLMKKCEREVWREKRVFNQIEKERVDTGSDPDKKCLERKEYRLENATRLIKRSSILMSLLPVHHLECSLSFVSLILSSLTLSLPLVLHPNNFLSFHPDWRMTTRRIGSTLVNASRRMHLTAARLSFPFQLLSLLSTFLFVLSFLALLLFLHFFLLLPDSECILNGVDWLQKEEKSWDDEAWRDRSFENRKKHEWKIGRGAKVWILEREREWDEMKRKKKSEPRKTKGKKMEKFLPATFSQSSFFIFNNNNPHLLPLVQYWFIQAERVKKKMCLKGNSIASKQIRKPKGKEDEEF